VRKKKAAEKRVSYVPPQWKKPFLNIFLKKVAVATPVLIHQVMDGLCGRKPELAPHLPTRQAVSSAQAAWRKAHNAPPVRLRAKKALRPLLNGKEDVDIFAKPEAPRCSWTGCASEPLPGKPYCGEHQKLTHKPPGPGESAQRASPYRADKSDRVRSHPALRRIQ